MILHKETTKASVDYDICHEESDNTLMIAIEYQTFDGESLHRSWQEDCIFLDFEKVEEIYLAMKKNQKGESKNEQYKQYEKCVIDFLIEDEQSVFVWEDL